MDCQVKRPVYIGADHTISSLGEGTDANFRKIRNYESGLRKVSDSSLFHEDFLAGRIDRDLIEADSLTDKFTFLEKLYIRVIDSILCTSDIDVESDSLKVIFSSTKGNIDLLKSETETIDPAVFLSETARRIHRHFGFKHTCEIISNACISGVSALIIAQRLIRTGQYDHVLVVGGDLLTHFVVSGFQSFHSVSENPCRPFDQSRDGLSLGEACAGVLLTSQTDKAIYPLVELKGGGISNDANHISGPSRTGDGLAFAIQAALTEADLPTQEIGLINAHGTATLFNDEMESKAIHLAGLEQVPVNSLKPYIGHTLGASGVIETILAVCQLREKMILGTPGFETCGVPMPLRVNASHQSLPLNNVLKLASGFGGCNAALILGWATGETKTNCPVNGDIQEIASCRLTPAEETFPVYIRNEYKAMGQPNMKFFKMDDLSKLGYIAAEKILTKDLLSRYKSTEIAIILANHASSLDTDIRHQKLINEGGEGASPAVFVYTLPNIVAGEIAIRHKIQGETTFFIADKEDRFPEEYARFLLKNGIAKCVIYGWCEYLLEQAEAEFKILTI